MTEACSNFCFPVPAKLENAFVKLVPFVVSEHAEPFYSSADDALFAFLPWGPFTSTDEFVSTVIDGRVKSDPGMMLFAIIDQASGALAGTIGLLDTSAAHLSTEIGFVITLPRFQRTHVTSNAAGLLLHWVLDTPAQGGLGLRRVAWRANALNERSVRAAERMGFQKEGVLKWARVLPQWKTQADGGKSGALREGDPKPKCLGGDSVILGLCWDDWEGGVREHVDKIMSRER